MSDSYDQMVKLCLEKFKTGDLDFVLGAGGLFSTACLKAEIAAQRSQLLILAESGIDDEEMLMKAEVLSDALDIILDSVGTIIDNCITLTGTPAAKVILAAAQDLHREVEDEK